MKSDTCSEKLSKAQICLTAAVFLICLAGAYLIKIEYTPDEYARKLLSDWIFENGRLPLGNEQEIIIPGWGFSYGYRPYLSAILAALFEKALSLFTSSEQMLLFGSRLCSVFSATACIYFCFKTGNELFDKKDYSVLYGSLICFTPQVLFLGMYQNCDSLAIAGVSALIYFLVRGWKTGWNIKTSILFGVAVSVCLLSYYSIYGWLLAGALVFLYSCLKDKKIKPSDMMIRIGIIAATVLILAGWFFIRNMAIHNGDIFGMASEEVCRNEQAALGMPLQEYDRPSEQGLGFFETFAARNFRWLHFTLKSAIATFGYMSIWLPEWLYKIFYVVLGSGALLYVLFDMFVKKESIRRRLSVLMISASAITIALSLIQSYFRDFQAQGRYIITVLFMIAYMSGCGYEKVVNKLLSKKGNAENGKKTFNLVYAVSFIWIGLAICVFAAYMSQMF